MSVPANPLNIAPYASHRHILIAFKYSEDAFAVERFNPKSAGTGESIQNIGENVVIVNEFINQKFTIPEAMWDFNFIPNIGVSTTSSVGKIVILEGQVPYSFLDFLRVNVLQVFGEEDLAISQVTFLLKTFFDKGGNETGEIDTIVSNPFYFNIDRIESIPEELSPSPNKHILHAIGAANSTGLLRSFSSIFQMNITHKDGNIHNKVPHGTGTNTKLKTRAEENNLNSTKRKERLDLSKPMVNLRDIFEGLEADLNQQKYIHQGQLQRWIRDIRSEDNTDKIVIAPQQTKVDSITELPMDFVVDLDPLYKEYSVDNRNMPFEQPDVNQENVGIRVFPVKTGLDIFSLVERLMGLSKRVGIDAIATEKKTFKTTITPVRKKKTGRYEINIKIRQYILPNNTEEENTGPGKAIEPLEFFVNDIINRDTDVLSFKSTVKYKVGDVMVEQQIEDNIGAGVVYADREQGTAERRPSLPFFKTLYSGIRPMIGSYLIDGLESAQRAGDIYNLMDRYTYTQTTDYEMVILGNPYLMSDTNRNPKDIIEDSAGEVVHYYPKPENDPMYLKLTIFEKSFDSADDDEIPQKFYFDNFYHLCRVVNIFGYGGAARSFYQHLYLRRTDSVI